MNPRSPKEKQFVNVVAVPTRNTGCSQTCSPPIHPWRYVARLRRTAYQYEKTGVLPETV
ncbi:MAG: hypothetical protein IH965_02945 [Gemmatimonadetes bacterium]|nr:hypothetical protein [Gemmatimonadota bacterium]